MIRQALVEEERWISKDQFNRLVAVMQVLPGPEAHELCVHLGVRAGGRLGGLAGGLGFMAPGFVLMLALAWAYTLIPITGTGFGALFLGVQAAVIALIIRAVHRIGEHILANAALWAIALAAAAASLAGVSFWIVLPTAGIAHALWAAGRRLPAALAVAAAAALALTLPASLGPTTAAAAAATSTSTRTPAALALFLAGLKGGHLTFGGAYTAIPFVRADTVSKVWLGDAAFLDGLGLSGLLPAPLVIFVTFVGFIAAGLTGAIAITAATASPSLAISAAITATCLALLYRWKNKLAPLAAVGLGAAVGLPLLG